MKHANALQVLRHDHRELQGMFHKFEKAQEREQEQLCREMVEALKMHTRIEEEVFYPYLREATGDEELFEEARIEHGTADQLLRDLENGPDGVHRHALVKVLGEYVGHHIREEEDRIFPLVEKIGVDLDALGEELMEHREGRGGLIAHRDEGASGGRADGAARREAREEADRPHHAKSHSAAEDRKFVEKHRKGLSKSTQRAQWIESPEGKEDHPGQTLATRSVEVIKAWADERNAKPATSPGGDTESPRVLRFDFPDYDKGLTHVSWDAWAKTFEDRKLVFLFQQHMKSGKQSNFFRLDSPEREDG